MDSLSDPQLNSLQVWLQWISVFSIALGLATAIGLIFVDKEIGKRQDLQMQKAERKISDLTPPPLDKRIIGVLESIDGKIVPAPKSGRTNFEGGLTPTQFNDLQKIASEPGAKEFIRLSPNVNTGLGMGPHGITYGVEFSVNPKVLSA
ncbi:MAG: hypothetical protein HQK65_10465 [Desulfamplus sp.]|nr:hypothetical protein [Desulfamplus sp.]